MSKAVIFIPRSIFLDSDRVMPALGPLYLKSFLESKGHKIIVEDSPNLNDLTGLEEYDVLSISCTTPQYYEINGGKELAVRLRKQYPNKKLIIGGAHATYYTKELIEDNLFDHIVVKDGEKAFLDILNGKELPKVIIYPKLSEEEMNSYPIPWRDKDYLSKYKYQIEGIDATTAITGKNCPMGCKYCESRRSGISLFSPERVNAEIESIKKTGFNSIMFFDDIFALSEERVKELCNVIRPHNITFRCFGHAKLLSRNKNVIKMLADAGCKEIGFGAESGDQGILNIVDKGNKVDDIFMTTQNILDAGLNVSAFLMIGLPGESKESIRNTERYIETFANNPRFKFDYSIFFPYKSTYIREHPEEFDLKIHLDGSLGYYKGREGSSECCVSTSHLSREEIIAERDRILRTYKKNFKGVESKNRVK